MDDNRHVTILSFTRAGGALNVLLNRQLSIQGYICESFSAPKYAGILSVNVIPQDREVFIGEHWGKTSFVFIGAAGIAIRYTAPWLKDKYTDSAVLCMDEKGRFVVPLIAGHLGGAAALAEVVAKAVEGTPVITTATDVRGKFAVDVFAKKHNLEISNRHLVKEISAAVLDGETIGIYSEVELSDRLPEEIVVAERPEDLLQYTYGVFISRLPTPHSLLPELAALGDNDKKVRPGGWEKVLCLAPYALSEEKLVKEIIVGIGCRKGVSGQHIEGQLEVLLEKYGLTMDQVKMFASIDIKKSEAGIVSLAEKWKIPFITYSIEALNEIAAVSTQSVFVQQKVGVDNVCERAAKRAAPKGYLIQPKICMDQVTFSLVREREVIPRILVFAGTTEGRDILKYLRRFQVSVIACVATAYGKTSLEAIEEGSNIEIREGRLTMPEMEQLMITGGIELVIDATHPFAREVTANIKQACQLSGTEYLRLLREGGHSVTQHVEEMAVVYKEGVKEAVDYLMKTKGNILISTGSKELKEYTRILDYKERCYARVLSIKQSVDDSVALGFEGVHLIAMQGPFSKGMNIATLEQTKAAYLVTKESGGSGGFDEKLAAVKELGIQLVVIDRPKEEGMMMSDTCQFLKGRYSC